MKNGVIEENGVIDENGVINEKWSDDELME